MLPRVLSTYPDDCQPESGEFLGSAGGFSGAWLWKLSTPRGTLCLRRWPVTHPTPSLLQWIHQVLAHVAGCGFGLVPVPIQSSRGNTVGRADGHLWELTPWMPGEANYEDDPTPEKLRSALRALANFHVAASGLAGPRDVSQGMVDRLAFTEKLLAGDLPLWQERLSRSSHHVHHDRCAEILRRAAPLLPALLAELQWAARTTFPLQPCLRDIWHDHVLFRDEEVTGLIDFGAMRVESVAGDVARLLGSLGKDERGVWEEGLSHYEQIRPLSDDERRVLPVLDRANVVLSGMNWIRWLFLEQRTFESSQSVGLRLDTILRRLRRTSETGNSR